MVGNAIPLRSRIQISHYLKTNGHEFKANDIRQILLILIDPLTKKCAHEVSRWVIHGASFRRFPR